MRFLFLVPSCAVVLSGCAGAAPQRVFTPLTAEDEVAFENGIDFIGDPSILEGSWLETWEQEVQRRCNLSEAVLLVEVRAVQENLDLDRTASYRIAARVETVRYGTGIADDVTLVSREHEAGYAAVREHQTRLLEQRFVAFIRWVEGDGGVAVARWHLSPATEQVLRRVNSLLNDRRPRGRPRFDD